MSRLDDIRRELNETLDWPWNSTERHTIERSIIANAVPYLLDEVERLNRDGAQWYRKWADKCGEVARLTAENERLRAAILDIDAHATPFAEDADGFVTMYVMSVGALHRALGIIGHSAAAVVASDVTGEQERYRGFPHLHIYPQETECPACEAFAEDERNRSARCHLPDVVEVARMGFARGWRPNGCTMTPAAAVTESSET